MGPASIDEGRSGGTTITPSERWDFAVLLFLILPFSGVNFVCQVWEDEPNPVEELTGKEWYDVFKPSDVEVSS